MISGGRRFYLPNDPIPGPSNWRRQLKGKLKARDDGYDYGNSGEGGVVLPLIMVQTTSYDAAYTIPLLVGSNQQNLSLQVDTGSSDLWIASKSCTSSPCSNTETYDPSVSSTDSGQNFSINYLSGDVSGPIVWDEVQLGGYSIGNQAMAAATNVENEPLSSQFSGILGLALPLNSIIASLIPPTESNRPDGAAFASNLFSLTPISSAPSSHFISLSLSRPDTPSNPKALLGIGRHPQDYVTDPKDVTYLDVVAEESGTHFWKISVQGISVWVNGQEKVVQVGNSVNGDVYPTAVLDSGVPLILTTSTIANGIYGALGIGPSSDGFYYLPCTTPINMTIQFFPSTTIPLHPLDLTAVPPSTDSTSTCVGLIQTADSSLGVPNTIGDMVFGVPFLRSVYTVMAYSPPDSNGLFNTTSSTTVKPFLGLVNLTDPAQALSDFNTIRVLQQPLPGSSGSSQSRGATTTSGDGKKIGIDALIGVMSFFALCAALFGLRWWMARRVWTKAHGAGGSVLGHQEGGERMMVDGAPTSPTAEAFLPRSSHEDETGASTATALVTSSGLFARFLGALFRRNSNRVGGSYELAARRGSGGDDPDRTLHGTGGRKLTEDQIRKMKFDAYIRRQQRQNDSSDTDPGTLVNDNDFGEEEAYKLFGGGGVSEFGTRRRGPTRRYPSYTSDVKVDDVVLPVGQQHDDVVQELTYDDPWNTGKEQRRSSATRTATGSSPTRSDVAGARVSGHERDGSFSAVDPLLPPTSSYPLIWEAPQSPPIALSPRSLARPTSLLDRPPSIQQRTSFVAPVTPDAAARLQHQHRSSSVTFGDPVLLPASTAPSEVDTEERAQQSGMAGVGSALRGSYHTPVDSEFGGRLPEVGTRSLSLANGSVRPGSAYATPTSPVVGRRLDLSLQGPRPASYAYTPTTSPTQSQLRDDTQPGRMGKLTETGSLARGFNMDGAYPSLR